MYHRALADKRQSAGWFLSASSLWYLAAASSTCRHPKRCNQGMLIKCRTMVVT